MHRISAAYCRFTQEIYGKAAGRRRRLLGNDSMLAPAVCGITHAARFAVYVRLDISMFSKARRIFFASIPEENPPSPFFASTR